MSEVAYAVSSGSYSDYRVHLVCLDHATAEAVCERMNSLETYPDYYVEELPIVQSPDQIVLRVEYFVRLRADGTEDTRWSNEGSATAAVLVDDPPPQEGPYICATSYRGFDVAEKAARDKLAEIKAREAGIA